MRFYYEDDADISLLKEKKIAIIGYGNQGRAHALNLHDSGLNVVVGLRHSSPTLSKVEENGLKAQNIETAVSESDIIVMLLPDEEMPTLYKKSIAPYIKSGSALGFAHGFNILYGGIKPGKEIDVILNSPKCIGYKVRENFVNGYGFPNLFAVAQDSTGMARDIALAYAKGIGGTRSGAMESSFKEETVTNLFAEQTVLCGGIAELIKAAYDTLVEAGYSKEVAYYECLHEIEPIIALFHQNGIAAMNERISNTAEYGSYTGGKHIFQGDVRTRMRETLQEIESGEFARRWMDDHKTGGKSFLQLRAVTAKHPIEKVGSRMRKMMTWLKEK